MALYNMAKINKRDGLKPCSVCKAQVAKRHYLKHLNDCLVKFEDQLDAEGLIKCPLNMYHVVPKTYLADHLKRRCEDVRNKVKNQDYSSEIMSEVHDLEFQHKWDPQNLLSEQTKKYLLIFGVDIEGDDIERERDRSRDAAAHQTSKRFKFESSSNEDVD